MPSFKDISPLVLQRKIFKAFAMYGHGSHFGYETHFISINSYSYGGVPGLVDRVLFTQEVKG